MKEVKGIVPGLDGVELTAAVGFDWSEVSNTVARQGFWMIGRFDLSEVARSFEELTVAERENRDTTRERRRAHWRILMHRDPRLVPALALVEAFRGLEQDRAQAWDPRLDQIGAMVSAHDEFWRAAIGVDELPPPDIGGFVLSLADRIDAYRKTKRGAPDMRQVGEARRIVNVISTDRLHVAQCLTAARMATVCDEVAAHAERIAARSSDSARGDAFGRLGERCRDIAAAARIVAAYSRF